VGDGEARDEGGHAQSSPRKARCNAALGNSFDVATNPALHRLRAEERKEEGGGCVIRVGDKCELPSNVPPAQLVWYHGTLPYRAANRNHKLPTSEHSSGVPLRDSRISPFQGPGLDFAGHDIDDADDRNATADIVSSLNDPVADSPGLIDKVRQRRVGNPRSFLIGSPNRSRNAD
jgi:hypothetical protein